jgi:hypothetical protein
MLLTLSVPYTLVLVSTTLVPPFKPLSVPILAVPTQWLAVLAPTLLGWAATKSSTDWSAVGYFIVNLEFFATTSFKFLMP